MREDWSACMRLAAGGALVVAAGLASGCMSSPTYGTDRTASAQLLTDIGNITSLRDKKRDPIDYSPRPELVKPGSEDGAVVTALPPPQDPITTTASAQWPESPEQRLARIRADATANQDNPNYSSPVVADMATSEPIKKTKPGTSLREIDSGRVSLADERAYRAEYEKRKKEKEAQTGSRKYLSDPPTDYEQAYASAPQDEVGESEWRKERRKKAEARKASGRTWWDDVNPF